MFFITVFRTNFHIYHNHFVSQIILLLNSTSKREVPFMTCELLDIMIFTIDKTLYIYIYVQCKITPY